MLRLKNITKNYEVAGSSIQVLKGLNLSFRKNEFVSILGPSGCGKTTTLNIIGGLDKYTSGDLFIAGKSTKEFNDRDWDIYRNQRIGFVFQSYNLIPHQTVLGNVELALTISGVSKEERTQKAMQALDKVGLKDEYHKKPNQLSGGQCQRIAIARALVNEPEILLADEPTGALDTQTSLQIMDLIKEIAKERLVIMVTHNPELAEQYSTRIVRLVDGQVIEDSNPYYEEEEIAEINSIPEEELSKSSKAKMSWWTAFKLSLRNLLSKKNRTIMTVIACSIGIIGVSSVLAVSSGVKNYIASMQDDMLSGNPITISESSYDIESLMNSMSNAEKTEFIKEEGYVNVDSMIEYIIKTYSTMDSAMIQNNITKDYIDYIKAMNPEYYAAINLSYGLDISNNIYTNMNINNEDHPYSIAAIKSIYTSLLKETSFANYASMITSLGRVLSQSLNNSDYILSQYDLKTGKVATEKDEIMVVLDSNSALTDVVLGELGYYSQEEFLNVAFKAAEDENYKPQYDKDRFTYDDILGKSFTYYPNNTVFTKNSDSESQDGKFPFTYSASSKDFADQGLKLKVVGILEPKETISYGCLNTGFYYTEALTKYMLEQNLNSEIVNYFTTNSMDSFTSIVAIMSNNGTSISLKQQGIFYDYQYWYNDKWNDAFGMVGSSSDSMSSFMSAIMGGGSGSASTPSTSIASATLSLQNLGGKDIPNYIAIYPKDFTAKDNVRTYLDAWNNEGDITVNNTVLSHDQREQIKYTDTLTIVINMINSMIDIVTTALVAFTALSLVVSCVMIAIITYVSVVERVKEIGVIRSLGGRKRDVSNLFNAETLMIGTASGLFGVGVTYLLSLILNLSLNHLIGFPIAQLPISDAFLMLGISIVLTVLSGLIPSRKAAQQDPVNALRSE